VSLAPGTRLGPYEVLDYLAQGGMGTVYRGIDRTLGRQVALKVLHPDLLKDASFAQRFKHEAAVWGSLDHPRIVPVYTADVDHEIAFLAMKLVPGGTLADRLKLGPTPLPEAVAILADVASALDHAHGKGIVHRDVKPANVLLEGGRAYLSDFGVAWAASAGKPQTLSGGVYGTPGYMAPEQARSQSPDARVDIYSLGCLTYEMLVGAPPFQGRSPVDVLMRHITEEPTPPRGLVPTLPAHVDAAVMKALSREPSNRWPTAALFVQALLGPVSMEGLQTVSIPGRAIADLPMPPLPKISRAALERRILAGLVVVLAGVLVYERVVRPAAAPAPAPVAAALAPPDASPTPSLDAVLSAVRRALDDGAYAEALQMADVALRLNPGNRDALSLRERVVSAWDAEKSLGTWASPPSSPDAGPVDQGASPR
jgi:serine/threonine protein kinase